MKQQHLQKQISGFHCGPATLAGASTLLRPGLKVLQEAVGLELGTRPHMGTCHHKLAEWCKTNLPVISVGEDTYQNGLAIANIRNPFSGNGHFVLMLGHDTKHTKYYCPLVNQTLIIPTSRLDWRNGPGTLKRWSINLAI